MANIKSKLLFLTLFSVTMPCLCFSQAWEISIVDSAGVVGRWTSLALDSLDYPHMSYTDCDNGDLKYAYFDDSEWHIESVDTSGNVGWCTSIALDPSEHPCIGYMDRTYGDVKYACWDGLNWNIEVVDTTGITGFGTSIALDEFFHPHIAYYDSTNGFLKYAHRNGFDWEISIIDSGISYSYWHMSTSIKLDNSGLTRIAYKKGDWIMYASLDGDTWEMEEVDEGFHPSLAIGSDNRPHVSYSNSEGNLTYAVYEDSTWCIEVVDAPIDDEFHYYTSIELGASDRPEISYLCWNTFWGVYNLKCAVEGAGWPELGWKKVIVDTSNYNGAYTSLEIDRHSYPCISYFDWNDDVLKYAKAIPDVGVCLTSPYDTVYTGSISELWCEVINCGIVPECFPVECFIWKSDTLVYADTSYDIPDDYNEILSGEMLDVFFDYWIVPSTDSTLYKVIFRTLLPYDENPANDSLVWWLFAYDPQGIEETVNPLSGSKFVCYPNPFISSINIKYTVLNKGEVFLRIYNVIGELVATLVDGVKEPGIYTLRWNGKTEEGNDIDSGIFFYRCKTGDYTSFGKILLLK